MDSRARDIGRHYESGSAKRKAQDEKQKKHQDVILKTRKVSEFFKVRSESVQTKEFETENTEVTSYSVVEGDSVIEESLKTSSLSSSQEDVENTTHFSNVVKTSKSQNPNTIKMYSNDIGEWPTNFNRDYWIAKGSSEVQHINSDFLSSQKSYDKENKPRFCQKSFFTYTHNATKKTHARDWLCYSETKGRCYCFVCKVTNSKSSIRFI